MASEAKLHHTGWWKSIWKKMNECHSKNAHFWCAYACVHVGPLWVLIEGRSGCRQLCRTKIRSHGCNQTIVFHPLSPEIVINVSLSSRGDSQVTNRVQVPMSSRMSTTNSHKMSLKVSRPCKFASKISRDLWHFYWRNQLPSCFQSKRVSLISGDQ